MAGVRGWDARLTDCDAGPRSSSLPSSRQAAEATGIVYEGGAARGPTAQYGDRSGWPAELGRPVIRRRTTRVSGVSRQGGCLSSRLGTRRGSGSRGWCCRRLSGVGVGEDWDDHDVRLLVRAQISNFRSGLGTLEPTSRRALRCQSSSGSPADLSGRCRSPRRRTTDCTSIFG